MTRKRYRDPAAFLSSVTKQAEPSHTDKVLRVRPASVGRKMTKKVRFGKIEFTVYSVGFLAEELHRVPATIRLWERKGVIPKPIIATRDGARWYLKEEIDAYIAAYTANPVMTGSKIESTGFPITILEAITTLKRRVNSTIKAAQEQPQTAGAPK